MPQRFFQFEIPGFLVDAVRAVGAVALAALLANAASDATAAAAVATVATVDSRDAALQAPPTGGGGDALYRALGGQPGLVALMDDFAARLLDDPRMRPFFVDVDMGPFKAGLVTQFCELSGGPCRRDGKDMRAVHAGQDVTRTNFNALVEVLQQSLDARAVPFATQNRLLALLAPMHREIVNTH